MEVTPSALTQPLPERLPRLGELVQVRQHRWLVEEVVDAAVPGQSPLVRLACADDDAQGQTLDVYWNYEIDRGVLAKEDWKHLATKGFDPPRYFAAFLHTLRWNCVTATDPNLFQSPFRAGIKIDAYQMEPLGYDTAEIREGAANACIPRPVRCLRCLLLVMCTHPFAKEALTLHLARSEGHERYFGCNLTHRKVLVSFHQHLMAEAPLSSAKRLLRHG